MLFVLAAAIVFAQAASPASEPAPQDAPAAQAAKPVKPEKPKLICHDETATGSIISQRVCRTPEQAAAEQAQSRREHDALSDHLAACHGAPSC
jgi:hypothetical protein